MEIFFFWSFSFLLWLSFIVSFDYLMAFHWVKRGECILYAFNSMFAYEKPTNSDLMQKDALIALWCDSFVSRTTIFVNPISYATVHTMHEQQSTTWSLFFVIIYIFVSFIWVCLAMFSYWSATSGPESFFVYFFLSSFMPCHCIWIALALSLNPFFVFHSTHTLLKQRVYGKIDITKSFDFNSSWKSCARCDSSVSNFVLTFSPFTAILI